MSTKTIRIPISGGIPVKTIAEGYKCPVLVCVRKFWGKVYFKFERPYLINGEVYFSETLSGFQEMDDDIYNQLLAVVGKEVVIDVESLTTKIKWSCQL